MYVCDCACKLSGNFGSSMCTSTCALRESASAHVDGCLPLADCAVRHGQFLQRQRHDLLCGVRLLMLSSSTARDACQHTGSHAALLPADDCRQEQHGHAGAAVRACGGSFPLGGAAGAAAARETSWSLAYPVYTCCGAAPKRAYVLLRSNFLVNSLVQRGEPPQHESVGA